MKRKRLLWGLCAAVLALALIACGDDPEDTTPTVTEVIVTSAVTGSLEKDGTRQFSAEVKGDNSPAQTVTWSIDEENEKHAGTTIDDDGLLTVDIDETLGTITVRATSTVNTSKSGFLEVTITGGSGGPEPEEEGNLELTITVETDASIENANIVDGVLTLAKGATAILTLIDSSEYTEGTIQWSVQNTDKSGTDAEFTLTANDFTSGNVYFVTVEAFKDNVPYNKTIEFTVEE